jgi:hypothetical protein
MTTHDVLATDSRPVPVKAAVMTGLWHTTLGSAVAERLQNRKAAVAVADSEPSIARPVTCGETVTGRVPTIGQDLALNAGRYVMGKPNSLTEHREPHGHVPGEAGSVSLALDAVKAALVEVGEERVELVETTGNGRVTIQPVRLDDGESIARTLGLDSPLDHRMIGPGYTLWSGTREGFEFQVRGALRHPFGGLQ